MVNFRRMRADFNSHCQKEAKELFEQDCVVGLIQPAEEEWVKFSCTVKMSDTRSLKCFLEFDPENSELISSECSCPQGMECVHTVAALFFLEKNYEKLKAISSQKQDAGPQKSALHIVEELQQYHKAADLLGGSCLFMSQNHPVEQDVELALVLSPLEDKVDLVDAQLFLRTASKPRFIPIPNINDFLDKVKWGDVQKLPPLEILCTTDSFDPESKELLYFLLSLQGILEIRDKSLTKVRLTKEDLSVLFAKMDSLRVSSYVSPFLPRIYSQGLDAPFASPRGRASLVVELKFLDLGAKSLYIDPKWSLPGEYENKMLHEVQALNGKIPGLVYQNIYYRIDQRLPSRAVKNIHEIKGMLIPEALLGTFVEYHLPYLKGIAEVEGEECLQEIASIPLIKPLEGKCIIQATDEGIEADLSFDYEGVSISALGRQDLATIRSFIRPEGILARNLMDEIQITEDLFSEFQQDALSGSYKVKQEKKLVDFMTARLPKYEERINFDVPQKLLEKFIFDNSVVFLEVSSASNVDKYAVKVQVEGPLKGVSLSSLKDALYMGSNYITLGKKSTQTSISKSKQNYLIFKEEPITALLNLFEELAITKLENQKVERPLWTLMHLCGFQKRALENIQITFSKGIQKVIAEIHEMKSIERVPAPELLKANLRDYQGVGIGWMRHLRKMFLGGILADDMGLGKTIQAISAVLDFHAQEKKGSLSLIVAPTSLVYNWKEELNRFAPHLRVCVIDGIPPQRKKVLESFSEYDVFVTSYTILQKDIDLYDKIALSYLILDEGQVIKNRMTQNAKAVKSLSAAYRLVLTGTPVENSLDELWSLFDFLMPGFLGTFESFADRYIRAPRHRLIPALDELKGKIVPFVMRRMKKDVLKELPPLTPVVYHCCLNEKQKELYHNFADQARRDLETRVAKEGFEKSHMHVLATLTRLKQICCHPAIFAKDHAEPGDSAKYDLLLDLVENLVASGNRTVIFSQYTKMLGIMRNDFQHRGIAFSYLDGTTKDRMQRVKEFNEDSSIPLFLVSLKAGGTGLNLVGADTVIMFDSWWNPAVEEQAINRIYRIGQKKAVYSYQMITKGTIEEKIAEMHNRKKDLVEQVVSSDEALQRFTWEEVWELLQT